MTSSDPRKNPLSTHTPMKGNLKDFLNHDKQSTSNAYYKVSVVKILNAKL